MKIAIIADIHDNDANLQQCLDWCKQNAVGEIICCGDICNSETLQQIANGFAGTIYLTRGNVELYDVSELQKYPHITYLGREGGVVHVDKFAVGICHEPWMVDAILERDRCDYVFYGHTHKPWEEKRGSAYIVNPGTLGGVFQKATFAVWETESNVLELKILEQLH